MLDVLETALLSLIDRLKRKGIRFEEGLTFTEMTAVETDYHFRFPADLRLLLQLGLPVGEHFPDWRHHPEIFEEKQRTLRNGILYDVSQGMWWDAWGKRPDDQEEALMQAAQHFLHAPVMVPVYAHRFLPSTPGKVGNPVFSIMQTDVILYGVDLMHYFENEFFTNEFVLTEEEYAKARRIAYWSDLLD